MSTVKGVLIVELYQLHLYSHIPFYHSLTMFILK